MDCDSNLTRGPIMNGIMVEQERSDSGNRREVFRHRSKLSGVAGSWDCVLKCEEMARSDTLI